MEPGHFNFPPVLHGDTFSSWHFQIVDCAMNPINLEGAEVDLAVASRKGAQVILRIPLEITSPYEGEVLSEAFLMDLEPYSYRYDLTIKHSNGEKFTYLKGVLPVLRNIE